MKNAKSLMISCANCPLNDGMVYTSMPPKFRCTVTNEYNLGEHMCGKVKIFYDENHKAPAFTTEFQFAIKASSISLTVK